MNILNSNTYNNQIYQAIVVNSNFQQDPQQKGRVQIYIPEQQYEYSDIYQSYMNAGDKASTGNMDKFPWAITLVPDLKEGNIVYGNFIQNDYSQFIVLGLDANNVINTTIAENGVGGSILGSGYDISGDELLQRATAIIVANEVGIDPKDYPDDIADSYFERINPDDNGAWSIGLLQWHANRAFNLLSYMTSYVEDWQEYWPDKSIFLYQDIRDNKANIYNYNKFTITVGSSEYNSVQAMLSSDDGKDIQIEYASNDVYQYIQNLQNNYQIHNPAVIIWLADLMNQYGSGIDNIKNKAREICNATSDNIAALDALVQWCELNLPSYAIYKTRRETTRAYVRQLESQGNLTSSGLIDSNYNGEGSYISGNGQYSYPFKGSATINSTWGAAGYKSGGAHNGVDFGLPMGAALYACTDGQLIQGSDSKGFGIYSMIYADDGNLIVYGHEKQHNGGSRRVSKGDLIGYVDSTGNSTGDHLHIGITDQSNGISGLLNRNHSLGKDPLPFFGISAGRGSTVVL